jgi:hypothetical protein
MFAPEELSGSGAEVMAMTMLTIKRSSEGGWLHEYAGPSLYHGMI